MSINYGEIEFSECINNNVIIQYIQKKLHDTNEYIICIVCAHIVSHCSDTTFIISFDKILDEYDEIFMFTNRGSMIHILRTNVDIKYGKYVLSNESIDFVKKQFMMHVSSFKDFIEIGKDIYNITDDEYIKHDDNIIENNMTENTKIMKIMISLYDFINSVTSKHETILHVVNNENKIRKLKEELSVFRKDNESIPNMNKELQSLKKRIKQESIKYRIILDKMDMQKRDYEEIIKQRNITIDELKEKVDDLDMQIQDKNYEIYQFTNECDELKIRINELIDDGKQLNDDINQCKEELHEICCENMEIAESSDSYMKRNNELEMENIKLIDENDKLKIENDLIKCDEKDLKLQYDTLMDNYNKYIKYIDVENKCNVSPSGMTWNDMPLLKPIEDTASDKDEDDDELNESTTSIDKDEIIADLQNTIMLLKSINNDKEKFLRESEDARKNLADTLSEDIKRLTETINVRCKSEEKLRIENKYLSERCEKLVEMNNKLMTDGRFK